MSNSNFSVPTEYYSVIIRQSRYGGVYEGAQFFCYSETFILPESYFAYLDGDDCEAVDFWGSADSENFGRGNSPDGALIDFLSRNEANGQNFYDYKKIVAAFDNRVADLHLTEHVERTDYYQLSNPIFTPRKNKEF